MSRSPRPVAVMGASPSGWAAAAQLLGRGETALTACSTGAGVWLPAGRWRWARRAPITWQQVGSRIRP